MDIHQLLDFGDLRAAQVADLLVPDELQLGIFEPSGDQRLKGVFEIAADSIGDDAKFGHFSGPR